MKIFKNDVLRDSHGSLFRVVDADDQYALLIDLNDKHALPTAKPIEDVYAGEWGTPTSPEQFPTDDKVLTAEELKAANDSYESIKPLLDDSRIHNKRWRKKLICKRAAELKCSPTTLYRRLRLWYLGGQTTSALVRRRVDRTDISFRPKPGSAPPGRPGGFYLPYRMNHEVKGLIKKWLRRYYLKPNEPSLEHTWVTFLKKHFRTISSDKKSVPADPGKFPSIAQYRRVLKTSYSQKEIIIARKGESEFLMNFAAKLGTVEQASNGVGHTYELDATVANERLAARFNRKKIVGKPTVYLIWDRESRLIVGFYFCFFPASWAGACQAILSLCEDKEALCKKYGLEYREEDWPAHCVMPQQIVGDRAEMLSYTSDQICSLGTIVNNPPGLSPQKKSICEGGFRHTQVKIAGVCPGHQPPKEEQRRRGKDYSKATAVHIDEFTAIYMREIIRHNRSIKMSYRLTPEQQAAGISATPLEIWNHGIKSRAGKLSRVSYKTARRALLPLGTGKIRPEGIEFKDCFYTCKLAEEEGWFIGRGPRRAIKLSYNSRLVDEVYLHVNGTWVLAKLTARSERYRGCTFAEVNDALVQMRKDARKHKLTHSLAEFMDALDFSEAIAEAATKAMKLVTGNASRPARRVDTKEDREAEAKAEEIARLAEAISNESRSDDGTPKAPPMPPRVRPSKAVPPLAAQVLKPEPVKSAFGSWR